MTFLRRFDSRRNISPHTDTKATNMIKDLYHSSNRYDLSKRERFWKYEMLSRLTKNELIWGKGE